ncbi:aconitate hydratase AcnA [Altererythrobacter sp. CC-YST694]|uniref:aconitate hydratase AcnA n=1 Tax=Altererythrobacter sp. CC-YST694 TaxID=2755038 RepID=UPI001D0158DE|nr:aconitate hydratase AcnA [Altererythrobacter sp. CC-YST694]MCB5423641.1 aconitate hydratase AcnA [Altererythrobacter sp. CC-YST694]
MERTLPTAWSRLDDTMQNRLVALPRSLRLMLENALGHGAGPEVAEGFVAWLEGRGEGLTVPFAPTRILMQDTAGVAALVDLAALRDRAARSGASVDASVPVDLVIDHSVKVDFSGTPDAAERNIALEFQRNGARYGFFKWAERAFASLRVVPPGNGICHQINLERLSAIARPAADGSGLILPEVVIGTDSHTTMINALGILGWGVGGIEVEVAALGQLTDIPIPPVTQLVLEGAPVPGVSATDVALSLTAFLRGQQVVDQIVEFTGPGAAGLSLPDRAAIANMCPEYGATAGLFAVDAETLRYLGAMGRSREELALYETYARQSGLWAEYQTERHYSRTLHFDLSGVVPVMAGPARPQDIMPLPQVPASLPARDGNADGAVLIAAITSCTNTANPVLMLEAGLLARRAVELGLRPPPWVKTSLAPGSRSMADLLRRAGLLPYLEQIGFSVVGFGCTTCVGNSGELMPEALTMLEADPALVGAAVLSGNRNFPNRIHPRVRANYLASPPLVVAAALAGRVTVDLASAPIGTNAQGRDVFLADLWPTPGEAAGILAQLEREGLPAAPLGNAHWDGLPAPHGDLFAWKERSLIIRRPPFFDDPATPPEPAIRDAAVLLWLGDSITTDHISPIGAIAADSPAARWLREHGWQRADHGGYGDFRGNHEVMLRGTFDNRRLVNRLASGEGNRALGADGIETSIYDAAQSHLAEGRAMVVWAGEAYGCGSARDWAAKGTALLGIRAVIARSFERIHRNNLIAMGVLPIRLDSTEEPALSAASLVTVHGLEQAGIHAPLRIEVTGPGGGHFTGTAQLATAQDVAVFHAGGIPRMLAGAYPG